MPNGALGQNIKMVVVSKTTFPPYFVVTHIFINTMHLPVLISKNALLSCGLQVEKLSSILRLTVKI